LLFYPEQALNFLFYPYPAKRGCYWAGCGAYLSLLCSASLQSNRDANSWELFCSVWKQRTPDFP